MLAHSWLVEVTANKITARDDAHSRCASAGRAISLTDSFFTDGLLKKKKNFWRNARSSATAEKVNLFFQELAVCTIGVHNNIARDTSASLGNSHSRANLNPETWTLCACTCWQPGEHSHWSTLAHRSRSRLCNAISGNNADRTSFYAAANIG